MAEDLSWIPENVTNTLLKSEAHYRSVGFKRTANLMRKTQQSASEGKIPADFYSRYVSLLKDDVAEFVRSFRLEGAVEEDFSRSVTESIDRIASILSDLDAKAKTPVFSGTIMKKEDSEAINAYVRENGIHDYLLEDPDLYSAMESVDAFYDAVCQHVYVPGRVYLVSQLELALGHDKMLALSEEILSVGRVLAERGEVFSDFRYAREFPGTFSDDESSWVLTEGCEIPISSFARWPLMMYYKVPILTAMLPVHNVLFFDLVQKEIQRKKSLGQ